MNNDKIIIPTQQQIDNCASWGWVYIGDGLFEKNNNLGWFQECRGFVKD